MIPYLNIHTHASDAAEGVLSVRCYEPSELLADFPTPPTMASVGHHPWKVGASSKLELANMAQLLQNKQVVAIGEVGLDKLCTSDFLLQQEILVLQLRMAACVQKPVIIHCVKAWDELLVALDRVEALPPVIIHGFRGKPQQAAQLISKGYYLSIGLKYNSETVKALPAGCFFLETDEGANSLIPQLYADVAALRNISVDELKNQFWETWQTLVS